MLMFCFAGLLLIAIFIFLIRVLHPLEHLRNVYATLQHRIQVVSHSLKSKEVATKKVDSQQHSTKTIVSAQPTVIFEFYRTLPQQKMEPVMMTEKNQQQAKRLTKKTKNKKEIIMAEELENDVLKHIK